MEDDELIAKSAAVKEDLATKVGSIQWKPISSNPALLLWKGAHGSDPWVWKCHAFFKATVEQIPAYWNALWEWDERAKWDATLVADKSGLLYRVNNFITIDVSVTAAAAAGVISSREFIDLRSFEKTDDGGYNSWCASLDHEGTGVKAVRGWNFPCGSSIALATQDEVRDHGSHAPGTADTLWRFELCWHSDMRGNWLLSSAVNAAMPGAMKSTVKGTFAHADVMLRRESDNE